MTVYELRKSYSNNQYDSFVSGSFTDKKSAINAFKSALQNEYNDTFIFVIGICEYGEFIVIDGYGKKH